MWTYNIRNFLRKSFKFGIFIPLSNLILMYANKIIPASWIEKIVRYRRILIERRINQILNNYMFIAADEIEMTPPIEKAPIWFCWLQGEVNLPDIPSLCLKSIRKYANGHPVIVITIENYPSYVQLPSHVIRMYDQGKLKNAHFADILRVSLLYQKGGLWLDSTILVTDKLPESIFNTLFYTIKNKEFGYYVSHCRWSVFVLGGWQHNPLYGIVSNLFYEYLLKSDCFVDYFMFDHLIDIVYKQNVGIKVMIDDVPFNNPHVHTLNAFLCSKYEENVFDELTRDTFLFKLNWKWYTKVDLEREPNNLYNHLKSLIVE